MFCYIADLFLPISLSCGHVISRTSQLLWRYQASNGPQHC